MKYVALFSDSEGNRFEYDVAPDSQGNPFIDGDRRFPLPYQLPDSGAEFTGYELHGLPNGLRSCDAADLLYKMERTLRRPARPNGSPIVKPMQPAKPSTLREKAYALQEQPIQFVPLGNESSADAHRRALAERGDQVARLLDQERQQENIENWGMFSPDQKALNTAAAVVKRQWTEAKNAQFAAQNGGHVIGNDGRAKKN